MITFKDDPIYPIIGYFFFYFIYAFCILLIIWFNVVIGIAISQNLFPTNTQTHNPYDSYDYVPNSDLDNIYVKIPFQKTAYWLVKIIRNHLRYVATFQIILLVIIIPIMERSYNLSLTYLPSYRKKRNEFWNKVDKKKEKILNKLSNNISWGWKR